MIVLDVENAEHGAAMQASVFRLLKDAGIACHLDSASNKENDGVVITSSKPPAEESPRTSSMLRGELLKKNRELRNMEGQLNEALDSIKAFHQQQSELYEDFASLRDKYDVQKNRMRAVLWDFLPENLDQFTQIPALRPDVKESEDRIGEWRTGKVLGEGQFAVVKEVVKSPEDARIDPKKVVVKRVLKDKILDVKNALRLNNEVLILQELEHPNIVKLVDVVHSPNYVYLVQERGGLDLFEYYRRNPGPASETFATQLMAQLTSVVAYVSAWDVAHRDLKPENILIGANGDVKLVDFGLCTKSRTDLTLDDFCGTPGFFAPEMLLKPKYDTSRLDAWSLGCVFLEVLLGHRRFAEIWMPAYSLDNLHNQKQFERELDRSIATINTIFAPNPPTQDHDFLFKNHRNQGSCVKALKEQVERSSTSRAYIFALLQKEPNERVASVDVNKILKNATPRRSSTRTPPIGSSSQRSNQSFSGELPDNGGPTTERPVGSRTLVKSPSAGSKVESEPERPVGIPRLSVRTKAKEVAPDPKGTEERKRLPPLSPASPKLEGAQEIMKLGDALMRQHISYIS